jgi:hypothetical protein
MVLKLAPAMPPPLRPARRRRLVALMGGGFLSVLAIAASMGLVMGAKAPSPPAATRAAANAAASPALPASTAAMPKSAPLLDAAQWTQLQRSLEDAADRDAETVRIVELLAYRRAVDELRRRRQPGQAGADLQALARRIDRGLPERIARREISGPEALRLKTAVLEVLEPDAQRRARSLAAWRDEQARAHPPAADPRDAQLLAAQQVLVARWRAQSPPGTPPDALLAELDALRQRIYEDPGRGEPR